MSGVLVTADTNILASGLVGLAARPHSPPARFIALWLGGEFGLVISEFMRRELARTLLKPYFARRVNQSERVRFDEYLTSLAFLTEITVSVTGVAPSPADDLVLATALSGGAQFLVTGDHELLKLKQHECVLIVGVQDFLTMLRGL